MILAENAAPQVILQLEYRGKFVFDHFADRDAGPGRNHIAHRLGVHGDSQQRLFPLEVVEAGSVSEMVIKYLFDPSQPCSPAPRPTVVRAGPPAKPPSDPLALKVPAEVAIYYLKGADEFIQLDLKPVVSLREPGKMSKFSPVKGHVVGSVIGPAAMARVATGAATFYARPGEKAAMEDFVLLSLEPEKGGRNLDFGTKVGKPVFPAKSIHQFESKEVMPGLFRLAVPPVGKGEYLFFILGSGDEKKGLLGKGYDFGVK